jgi:DNA polymerase-3 subunit delta'
MMGWELAGHDWAVTLLKQHMASDQVRHAYLFSGSAGIGRRTLALRFAKAVNCPDVSDDLEPCGKCRICRQFERMEHPDLTVIDIEEDSQSIKVDQVRELQRTLSLTPIEAKYRVALLLNFQNATESAQNALLKTLEEAPSRAILLVTVDSVDHLLPTIVSRCEILRMRTMPVEMLKQYLIGIYPSKEAEAAIFASVSGGRVGEALTLIAEPEKAKQRTDWIDLLLEMVEADRVDRFKYVEKQFRYDRERLHQALQVWLTFWRDVLVYALQGDAAKLIHVDYKPQIVELNTWITETEIRGQINALTDAEEKLESNANTQLLAEVLLLGLPSDM